MSRKSQTRRKNKGVTLRPGDRGVTKQNGIQEADVVPTTGDIYQSVVALFGFDPIREAEERRLA